MRDRRSRVPSHGTTVLDRVDAGAASIEQAFLLAGQGLGRGLDTFNGMSTSLADLLAALQGGRMAEASTSIGMLAATLTGISEALPRDAAVLQALSASNAGIAKHLDTLLEHLRMMTIIASSARIEAAVFGEAAGLDSFTLEIGRLTAAVRTAVSRCAGNHAAMTERVGRLSAAQTGLDRDFRERLLVLARELSDTFGLITERQARSHATAQNLQALSAGLAQNAGSALMALQSGDAARQRLEHVAAALRLAPAIAGGRSAVGPLDAAGTKALLAALHGLQATQLADLADHFATDAGDINGLLDQLGQDATRLVAESRAVLGTAGRDGGSFLSAFRGRLAAAADLVGTCDRARQDVAHAMETLRTEVTALSRTIAELDVTARDLIVVGINAGLKATRLGLEGRSLMVIADELKRLAGLVTEAASHLVGAYEDLVRESRSLDRDDRPATASAEMQSIAGALEASDAQMSGFIATLQDQARGFAEEVKAVRAQFAATVNSITMLRDDADALDGSAAATPDDYAVAAPHLAALLCSRYTMAREREVHAAIAGDAVGDPAAASDAADSVTFDDILFDEAV